MARTRLVESVLAACRGDQLLAGGGAVVVAVSGGADSTALLHALSRGAPALGLELTAAHFDHRVRRGSGRDADAVGATCGELGIRLVTGRAASGRTRSEDGLRRARYRFLEDLAGSTGAHTIALGHTADDQVETVLLHLLRGTGLQGLAAMSVRDGLRFRPLLKVWRADVESYCRRHRLSPVDDPSNRSLRYTRNRVRHQLLPQLAGYNPRVRQGLLRLADSAREEHAVVTALAAAWLASGNAGSRASLAAQPPAVQVEVARRTWAAAATGSATQGDAARLRQAVHLMASRTRSRGMMDLGRGLQLHVSGDRFQIVQQPPKKA